MSNKEVKISLAKKLNPSAVDVLHSSSGGTPELPGPEILLGLVGCDSAYSSLVVAMSHYTNSDPTYLNTVTLSHRKEIINDCIIHYRQYLGMTRQKMKIHVNTMAYISNVAIDAEIMDFKHDDKKLLDEVQKFNYKITKYKFDTKYKEIINQCFVCIGENLTLCYKKIYERLEKS